jgi:tetratricopeptide (TPR) repeat protein
MKKTKMKKILSKILMTIFCFLLLPMHHAQSKERENRKILYRKELKLYENEIGNNPKAYISKFNTLREKSLKDNDWEVATDCLYHKACCFYYINKSDSSVVTAQKAIEEANKHGLKYIKAKAMGLLSLEYSRKGFTNRAFKQPEEALNLLHCDDHKNRSLLCAMGIQISMYANDKKNQFKYSTEYVHEARLSGSKPKLLAALIAKGKMEMDQGNYDVAENNFKEAALLSDQKNNYQNAHLNMVFGELFFKQEKYDEAISSQLEALKSAMVIEDKYILSTVR